MSTKCSHTAQGMLDRFLHNTEKCCHWVWYSGAALTIRAIWCDHLCHGFWSIMSNHSKCLQSKNNAVRDGVLQTDIQQGSSNRQLIPCCARAWQRNPRETHLTLHNITNLYSRHVGNCTFIRTAHLQSNLATNKQSRISMYQDLKTYLFSTTLVSTAEVRRRFQKESRLTMCTVLVEKPLQRRITPRPKSTVCLPELCTSKTWHKSLGKIMGTEKMSLALRYDLAESKNSADVRALDHRICQERRSRWEESYTKTQRPAYPRSMLPALQWTTQLKDRRTWDVESTTCALTTIPNAKTGTQIPRKSSENALWASWFPGHASWLLSLGSFWWNINVYGFGAQIHLQCTYISTSHSLTVAH